jgi:non-specific serine/threonine protein kinase
MHEVYGIHLTPLARSRTNYEGYLAAARSRLDEAAFEAAWAEGKAMTPEEAVEYVLTEEDATPPTASASEEPPDELTRREEEVAILVARGLTNRRIADALTLSERTVDNHVANILKKLNLSSRSGVATWVEERRLHGTDPD